MAAIAGGGLLVVGMPVALLVAITGLTPTAATCDAPPAATVALAPGDLGTFLAAIRTHESGGDYTAANPSSTASGAYQFIDSTWRSESAPAGAAPYARAMDAPPAVQDAVATFMATNLYNSPAGNHAWANVAGGWYLGHVPLPSEMDVAPPGNGNLTPRMYEDAIAALMAGQPAGATTTTAVPTACLTSAVVTLSAPGVAGYIDPITPSNWTAARTDQGVDWVPTVDGVPILAIGDGVITFSSTATGWPFDTIGSRGGGFIVVHLTAGPKAGQYYYVAEHLINLAPVGTVVKAGDTIAQALTGYAWSEWGWAAPIGDSPCGPCLYAGQKDGTATIGGKMFARFLRELGAVTADDPGAGTDSP